MNRTKSRTKTSLAVSKPPKLRVLVVDDDDKIIRFVNINLKLAGYDVVTAQNGEIALKLVASEKPDIMVLDIVMPVMDGFEVLRRVRAVSDMPVIIFSAHSSATEKALRLGANDFLNKPFNPVDLLRKIKTLENCRTTG